MRAWGAGPGAWAIAAVLSGLWPLTADGQGRTRVTYDVEFSTTGGRLDANCSASGTDVLVGTLTGFEPAEANEPNVYAGVLQRTTQISICGSRRGPDGTEVVCGINIAGGGYYAVKLTIEEGARDGWLQYLSANEQAQWAPLLGRQRTGRSQSSVTGTCDPAEMAQLQAEYDEGETAGSPNGQPIEIKGLPPAVYPATFAANPPVSIWTLKVIRKRP